MHRTSFRTQAGHFALFVLALSLMTSGIALSGRPVDETSALETESVYLPLLLRNFDSTLGVPLFGVQMYGSTGSNSPYYGALLGSDASWVRVPVSWQTVEPENTTPPSMNWASVDNALAAAWDDMGGLNLIATVIQSPAWAVEDWNSDLENNPNPNDPKLDVPIDSEDLGEFAEFVGAMVERYDGDGYQDATGSPVVNHWEFGNEPDSGDRSWSPHWGDHGDQYAQMLSYAYPAVKAANGRAQVLLGGIAYDWFYDQNDGNFNPDFLDDVLSAGGGQYFDIMNFHYYPIFASNWRPPGSESIGLIEKTQALRAKLNAYGYDDIPFFITEAGWHSSQFDDPPSTPETQSRYVVELFVQSMAGDIEVMIWWSLADPGGFYPQNGLVNLDTPPAIKPSYYVYQALVAQLSTAHFERTLPLAETGVADMEVHQFLDNVYQRKVYIAWIDPIETNATRSLRLTAARATVRDFYGRIIASLTAGSDGKVTIQVSGRPIYIEVEE